jgi:hypothetical protein
MSNVNKFKQSHHRPFYKKPLNQDFGYKGITMAAAATLAGAYEPHVDIPEYERLLLTALQKPQGIFEFGPIPETILLNSYRAFWLHAKENTSSYPHTLLFSTMKAGAQSNLIA